MRLVLVLTFLFACTSETETDTDEVGPAYHHLAGDPGCVDMEDNVNGPFHRNLEAWKSDDGTFFEPMYTFQYCADVPSLATNGEGRVLSTFQGFVNSEVEAQWDKVAVRTSTDGGSTWGELTFMTFEGMPEGSTRPFDPTVTFDPILRRWRLYFSMGMNGEGLDDTTCTYSARSVDGVAYTFEEGARFCVDGGPVIDPAVLEMDGTWYYSAPRGAPQEGAHFATSSDGLNFTAQALIPSDVNHSWTGNFVRSDTGLRFYGREGLFLEGNVLWWAETIDEGLSWSSFMKTDVPAGKDPGLFRMDDGTWFMLVPTPNPDDAE